MKDYARRALNGTYRLYIDGKNDMSRMEACMYLHVDCGFTKREAIDYVDLLIDEFKE